MSFNKDLVNVTASHNSGFGFTSTVDPRCVNPDVMPAIVSKVEAAAASKIVGGGINRKKINKISRKYKMKGSKRRVIRRMKSRVRSRFSKRSAKRSHSRRRSHSRKRSASRGQKGGYAQYQNNTPMTQTYSTGGNLSPALSALASPVPYQVLSNCTNCVDNYNHFTNGGFPSRGSY
jgi:hypothetical protein